MPIVLFEVLINQEILDGKILLGRNNKERKLEEAGLKYPRHWVQQAVAQKAQG
jgi:hypothetical protein